MMVHQDGQQGQEPVYAGIDTHTETHHVAVIDAYGRRFDDRQVVATARGYRQVLAFLAGWANVLTRCPWTGVAAWYMDRPC